VLAPFFGVFDFQSFNPRSNPQTLGATVFSILQPPLSFSRAAPNGPTKSLIGVDPRSVRQLKRHRLENQIESQRVLGKANRISDCGTQHLECLLHTMQC
jgi:hypothetical protein